MKYEYVCKLRNKEPNHWEKLKIQERMKIIYVVGSRVMCGVLWASILVLGRKDSSLSAILGKEVI